MQPKVEYVDLMKAEGLEKYCELLVEGYGILDKAENNTTLIRVLVKQPEKKIETLKK